MLRITVSGKELEFEHSLVSLSKWESEFERPFFQRNDKDQITPEQMMRYIELMYVGKRKREYLIGLIGEEELNQVVEYINAPRTATVVREIQNRGGPKEHVTSELIYYWMVMFKIPFSPTDEWHLNRLMMLVKICGIKNDPKKQSKADTVKNYRELNEQRRRLYGTKG